MVEALCELYTYITPLLTLPTKARKCTRHCGVSEIYCSIRAIVFDGDLLSGYHTAWTSRPTDCIVWSTTECALTRFSAVTDKFAPHGAIYPGTLVAIAMWERVWKWDNKPCGCGEHTQRRWRATIYRKYLKALLAFVAVFLGYRGLRRPHPRLFLWCRYTACAIDS
jgi:hypothetical protein